MAPEMSAASALEVVSLLADAGVEAWLDGGWAVDAALGEQTRAHKDLDVIVRVSDLPALRSALAARRFGEKDGGTASNFVLADGNGLEVDVHAVTFDGDGDGRYEMENGDEWVFPAHGFTGTGTINGRTVRCLTPEVQVLCHAHGYTPCEKDFRDMELLAERFGIQLPPQLTR